ncbi:hypothetical protein V9T40_008437 [Parthenolecanium corni]|uniref:DnaJ-like protein n=1 Tax=Parthenolecanium corni TaxID=536013 RepID=A0AAN9Y6K6_9HEMI
MGTGLPKSHIILFAALLIFIENVKSWNTDELEVFDAADEIKQNFYGLLNVSPKADFATIRKSFRLRSLAIHPDHNPSPTADEEFRHLVLAYDILKSAEKRKYYDNILENGLPDWRQAVYYYRRVRKMGMQEMLLILTIIISIGQYLVAWGSYLEQKFTLKELLKGRDKKLLKKTKRGKNENLFSDEFIESNIPKPSIRNTLPFQLVNLFKGIVIFLIKLLFKTIKGCWNREPKLKENIRPRSENLFPRPVQDRPKKMKKVNFIPELIEDPPEKRSSVHSKSPELSTESSPVISGGLWTDDDILMLVKLVNKHPAGEPERWTKIAQSMNRSVPEVTHMANKIKDNDFRIPAESEKPEIEEEPRKVKTKGGKLGVKITEEVEAKNSSWNQAQQKAFEMALMKYSKKTVIDRWEKIANCVPGKTKEDCILRYKKIAAVVRQKQSDDEHTEELHKKNNETDENSPINDDNQTDDEKNSLVTDTSCMEE